MKGKTPSESLVQTSQIVMPGKTNSLGNLMGGHLMYMMDMAAGMTAAKHAGKPSVTVYVSDINFNVPVEMGNFITVVSKIIWTGRTSMEIMVDAFSENYTKGTKEKAVTARFTFVALDENKKPVPVPPLLPETEEEKRLYEVHQQYVNRRKASR